MNDDDLAAFVRHVTHRPVRPGMSQAELFALLAHRYEIMEFAHRRFVEQLQAVIASIKAITPAAADEQARESPGSFVCGGFNCPCNDRGPCPDPSCTCNARKEQAQTSTA